MQQAPFRPPFGTPFIELQSVDSTNNYARGLLHAGLAQHGTAVFAWEQTAGKGQRGKIWTAEKGKNITLSLVIDPSPLQISEQFGLIAATGLAAREFFSRYAGDAVKLKWPNDIYWQDRKAGGILVESVVGSQQSTISNQQSGIGGQWKWAIAGMGININQGHFSPDLPNPVSLKQVTGKDFDLIKLTHELCEMMDRKINKLLAGGFREILDDYNACLYKRNETVQLKKDNRVFDAVIKQVNSSGTLVVQTSVEEFFEFGELEWV